MAKRIARIHPEFNLRLNSRTDASLLFQALPDIFGPGSVSYTGKLRTFDLGALFMSDRSGLTAKHMSREGGGRLVSVTATEPREAAALVVLSDRLNGAPQNELHFETLPDVVNRARRNRVLPDIELVAEQAESESGPYARYLLRREGSVVEKFRTLAGSIGSVAASDMLGVPSGRFDLALGVLGEAITATGNLQAATMVINGLGAVAGVRTGKG